MAKQYVCEECGITFTPKNPRGKVGQRFCSITCRNRRNVSKVLWPSVRERKFKVCPQCGHVGYRAVDLCTVCDYGTRGARRHVGKDTKWTPEQVAYLREHYPTDGAEAVASALGFGVSAVRCKARKLGVALSDEARHRLIHQAAREYMTEQNPMRRPEVVTKVKAWWEAHPEEALRFRAATVAAQRRVQRDKPSKLEQRLRDLLTQFGVAFEPSAVIKERFIVDIRIGSLIIQADGDYWHGHPRFAPLTPRQLKQQARDRSQDAYLRACGYTVVRIWESDMTRGKVAALLREHGLIAVA